MELASDITRVVSLRQESAAVLSASANCREGYVTPSDRNAKLAPLTSGGSGNRSAVASFCVASEEAFSDLLRGGRLSEHYSWLLEKAEIARAALGKWVPPLTTCVPGVLHF